MARMAVKLVCWMIGIPVGAALLYLAAVLIARPAASDDDEETCICTDGSHAELRSTRAPLHIGQFHHLRS